MNAEKIRLSLLALVAAIAVIGGASAKAGETVYTTTAPTPVDTGFYFDGFGGVLFLEDLSGSGATSIDAEFDTGYLAGGTLGYELSPAFAIEIEGAHGEADLEGLSLNGVRMNRFDGDLSLTQAAVNFIYEFENNSSVTPYVGVGVGAGFVDADFRYPGGSLSDDDTGFLYQFIGGVSIDLNPRTSLYAEYRYGSVEDLELQGVGGSVEFDDLNSHQAKVGVQIKF